MSSSDRRYNGYRSDTLRLEGWDYRGSAWYFVTVCTRDRVPYFGTVRDGIVGLSPAGCIAVQEGYRTPEVRPYVRLGAWIVMPNHVHGLIGITTESPAYDGGDLSQNGPVADSSRRDESAHGHDRASPNEFRLHAHSLGAIVGQYKSVCTKRIRGACRPDFAWQSRYYDRIVRTRREWNAVRRYILRNPADWTNDDHFPST